MQEANTGSSKTDLVIAFCLQKVRVRYGVVVHACNPGPWEDEAEGAGDQGRPPVHSDFKTNLGYIRPASQKWRETKVWGYTSMTDVVI